MNDCDKCPYWLRGCHKPAPCQCPRFARRVPRYVPGCACTRCVQFDRDVEARFPTGPTESEYTPPARQLPAKTGPDTFLAIDSNGVLLLIAHSIPDYLQQRFEVSVVHVYG